MAARQERIDAFIHEGSPPADQPLEAVPGASVLRPSATTAFAAEHRSRPRAFHREAARRIGSRPSVQWPRCRPQPHHYATPSQNALVDQI
jgi:hypothetical protein